jgi:hypothetical protein
VRLKFSRLLDSTAIVVWDICPPIVIEVSSDHVSRRQVLGDHVTVKFETGFSSKF